MGLLLLVIRVIILFNTANIDEYHHKHWPDINGVDVLKHLDY